jgi:hypothetical protein
LFSFGGLNVSGAIWVRADSGKLNGTASVGLLFEKTRYVQDPVNQA